MRLVSACEIMLMEYQILDTLPTTDAEDPRCQAHLREGRSRMDIWHSEWDLLLSEFPSLPSLSFYEDSRFDRPIFPIKALHAADLSSSSRLRLYDSEVALLTSMPTP